MKTGTIHRYPITAPGLNVHTLDMPTGAIITSITPGAKGLNVYAWHEEGGADAVLPTTARHFLMFKTGVPLPLECFIEGWPHLTLRGGLHVWEITAKAAALYAELYPAIDAALAE